MQIEISNPRKGQRGISLVEILIVLAILAMVAGVVVINAPPGRSSMRETSDRFAARLDFAAQEAITNGTLIGLSVDQEGYGFYRYNRGGWTELEEKSIAGSSFDPEYSVSFEIDNAAKKNEEADKSQAKDTAIRPAILLSSTGETTPFTLIFVDTRETIRVALDNAGHVKVIRDEPVQ